MSEVNCQNCDCWFTIIWQPTFEGERPEYCPMCGAEMDYSKAETREG